MVISVLLVLTQIFKYISHGLIGLKKVSKDVEIDITGFRLCNGILWMFPDVLTSRFFQFCPRFSVFFRTFDFLILKSEPKGYKILH